MSNEETRTDTGRPAAGKKKFFYARLAITNLKNNYSMYVPYILACIGTVFTFYLLLSLSGNEGMKNMPDSDSLKMLFQMGVTVNGVFSVVFIFYANSFLMKQRKKEIGLYSILGLEKRHISYVMFFEMLFISILGIGTGISLGMVFGKLCFLILLRMIRVAPDSRLILSGTVAGQVVLFFGGLFLATFAVNYIQVRLRDPISLLRDEKAGEKEPRSSALLTMIGVLGIGGGYFMAQRTEYALASITIFLAAVISVMIGTYAMFTAGSITILKFLKKKKSIYYQPNFFISISNMLYRMKKNASGLAGICIISTMILVVLSTTMALFLGREDMVRGENPYDFTIRYDRGAEGKEPVEAVFEKMAEQKHVKIDWQEAYFEVSFSAAYADGQFAERTEDSYPRNGRPPCELYFVPLPDYNRLSGSQRSLEDGQAFLYCKTGSYKEQEASILKEHFLIKEQIDAGELFGKRKENGSYHEFYFIVKDEKTAQAFITKEGNAGSEVICANLSGLHEMKSALAQELADELRKGQGMERGSFQIRGYDDKVDSWNHLYGGLLFLGIILGLLFLIAMVLIIYFKQVSEGYEDRMRFHVMEKVGMSKEEIKEVINKQVQIVFFLPVAGAVIHLGFAFRILGSLLLMLGFADDRALLMCMIVVVILFSALYFFVYTMTKRTYRRIIHKN